MTLPGPTSPERPKIGYRLMLLNRAIWNKDAFAGICLANGCPVEFAWKVAEELGTAGERKITVRPQIERELFIHACRWVGVRVEEIPPL